MMKKVLFLLLALISMVSANAATKDDGFLSTNSNLTVQAGSSVKIPISLTNKIDIYGVQCDIYLSSSDISLKVNSKGKYVFGTNADRVDGQTESSKLQTDGAVRYMLADYTAENPFYENEGELFYININVAEGATGEHTVTLKGITLATDEGKILGDNIVIKLTVPESSSIVADRFKTDHAGILGKTTASVASSDLDAIESALNDYNKLSVDVKALLTVEKALLDSLKAKVEELKAADAAATAAANQFKNDNVAILAKTIDNVTSADLAAINKALEDYNALSDAAKAKLTDGEKALLDALKAKAEEIKAAEEAADAAATAAANQFKTDNAAILAKTTENVASADLTAINKALSDYNALSDAAKAKLTDGEKALLDALKAKAEEIKAAEEAADAAATAAANKFKTDNAAILAKTTENVASADLTAINKALSDYNELSDAAKAKLTDGEKALLDALKAKAEEIKAAEEAADAAATAAANKFKTDNATILAKTTATVTSSDLAAINKALEDYNALSDAAKAKLTNGEKSLLDALKAKAEEIKAAEEAADAAATAEANQFKTDNAAILAKTTENVASSDLAAINKALSDYNALSDAAKAKLTNGEKALLDALKAKAEEIKAAEEAADAAATAAANQFKNDNAAILAKTTENVASADLTAINKALDDYGKLSDAAKAKLTNGEKALLDALKAKAEEIKAAEEAADAAATAAANKFKTDNATILAKTIDNVTSADLTAINKALEDYNKLSDAAKAKLTDGEKALLDALKSKAEEIKAAEEAADAAATAAANKFKTDNATILAKTIDNVTSADLAAINKALEDYNALSDAAKAKLTDGEKALLDALKAKAEEIKAAEEAADAAATAEANQFKTDNAAILAKTTENVASADLTAINKALDDYGKLSDAAKAKLTNGEKALLDALKAKAEEIRAAEEAADAAATAAANQFKTDNAAILAKTTENVASADLTAINKALSDYNELSEAAKAKLTDGEKALLDALKAKAEEIKAAEEAADAAATAEANQFKTDNAAILAKTIDNVTSADLSAINKALEDYNKLSDAAKTKLTDGEKALLDALKAKAEEIKAAEEAADAAATAAANKFKTDNAAILAKTTENVASADLTAINKALDDYGKLSDAAKAKLTNGEKALLDALKAKAEEIKAAEEAADAAATAAANQFKTDNAAILAKTTENVASSDLAAINKALEDYNALSDAAKAKLTNGEKALLDALKAKAEEIKAAEEAADATATAAANQFKTDNAAILAKTTENVASADLTAINKALSDYNALSDAAKAKLTDGEKALLDALKAKAEEIKAAEEAADVTTEVDKFLTDNNTILGKTTADVTPSDLDAIDTALNDYNNLSNEAKALLTEEKTLLDNFKAKAERIKKYDINGDNKITIADVTELIDVIVNQ